MVENRNLILAIVLSVAILFGFDFVYSHFYPKPVGPPPQGQITSNTPAAPGAPAEPGAPTAPRPDQRALPNVAAPDALTPAPAGTPR